MYTHDRVPTLRGKQARLIYQILERLYDWGEAFDIAPVSPTVLAAVARVSRAEFVPAANADQAYVDESLDIACNQRISAPSIVALMTDLLLLERRHRVLEVGTGSGYQTAVLSQLVDAVYSIELEAELAATAVCRLHRLGHTNIAVLHGDGREGWSKHAPFDRIMITAAAGTVPSALINQLVPGGRMILPAALSSITKWPGTSHKTVLAIIEKGPDGGIRREDVMPVRFVPLRPTSDELTRR